MKYIETRIVYEDSCWFCPQYKWCGIWWSYKTFCDGPGERLYLRAQFLTLEQAETFIQNCLKYEIYKGPK